MYTVEYINCRVCGSDVPKFLGTRGNREYAGAEKCADTQEHMVTNVVKCRKCNFIYTNPLIKFDTGAYKDPDSYKPSNIKPELLFGHMLDFIERYAEKGRMLDVGCGKAEFLSVARKRGWEACGLEPSRNLAKFAQERYGLNVDSASLKEAGYNDRAFDVVTLNMVLEHVDNPKELLAEINRILSDKGSLFIEVPNMDSLMLKIAHLYFRAKRRDWSPLLSPLHYPFHCYGYNISSLKYLLNTGNFYIDKILVRDSSLRGFRPDSGGAVVEKVLRNVVTKSAGIIGKGDVLMVIARKRP